MSAISPESKSNSVPEPSDIDGPAKYAGNRLLRLPEVMARVGMKRSAIYQRMSDGRFPKSRSLGAKCAVWVEREIEEWIERVANSPHGS
ncbi:AlpA family transcriptional regulator [Novosphingobium kunmingense]|uniref:AlpA family transcriptional regulator n=1 Tax=Novosphingobium kunmingense TaxID=1211806 RepID=A0A2N0I2G7_9SPHN|nr:AlpA family phage regulatory protein [Novosphingobium kunmingense]PKB25340.1 AlpA family transcriptional regulator [Novosphingobium kunmingense]